MKVNSDVADNNTRFITLRLFDLTSMFFFHFQGGFGIAMCATKHSFFFINFVIRIQIWVKFSTSMFLHLCHILKVHLNSLKYCGNNINLVPSDLRRTIIFVFNQVF